MTGMLIVDKPAGLTSHDVVAVVRRRLECRAGHTGTLDPQATGVLLICLGRATRLARFLQHQDKRYDCAVRLGWATDTYDADGQRVGDEVRPPDIDATQLRAILDTFEGAVQQIPPVYSAKKIRGQPAYRRARRGEHVEHRPVEVRIESIELLAIEGPVIRLRVHCGPGTYVRTLAHDIGTALDCPAHLAELRRLEVGGFGLERAVSWELVQDGPTPDLADRVLDASQMFPGWPAVVVTEEGAGIVRNGGVLEPGAILRRAGGDSGLRAPVAGDWVSVLRQDGTMIAAAQGLPGGVLQPRVVLR